LQPVVSQAVRPGVVVEVKPSPGPRVAVLIVTWNRKDMAAGALEAVQRQTFARSRLDVVVIDNASTDGTVEWLVQRFGPELIVDNPTMAALAPEFRARPVGEQMGNKAGFGSLTIVRNGENLGGCGGFNTGLMYVERVLAAGPATGLAAGLAHAAPGGEGAGAAASRPEFVWLVDDDVDLPPDALTRLVEAMGTDPKIGLVGSRTVDLRDRKTTIESTIYQERATGVFADQPDAGHPRRAEHEAWVATVGGTKGRRSFTGLRDVDIVSACSLLARWSAVEKVGMWDERYFIYCDDADWCLRFARAGYRVVVNLDAVVFHQPWHQKLTPARLYYAQRNLLWTIEKSHAGEARRGALRSRARALREQALEAGLCHRLGQAEVIRRSLDDAVRGRAGKLEIEGGKSVGIGEVAAALGVAGRRSAGGPEAQHPFKKERPITVAFVLTRPMALDWATGMRKRLAEAMPGREFRWVEFERNDVPGAHEMGVPEGVERVVYAPHAKSRLRRQAGLVKRRADLLVIFDGACDLPLVRAPRWILHVDSSRPTEGVLERGGLVARARFLGHWVGTAMRSGRWVRRGAGPSASRAG